VVGGSEVSGTVGEGWADGDSEFVGAVRLRKLLAGELEPSGVKENGLVCVSSVSTGGIMKESGEFVAEVCRDVASRFSIDEREAKRPCARGCFFQAITVTVWVGVQCSGVNVVLRWYVGSVSPCRSFAVSQFRSFAVS